MSMFPTRLYLYANRSSHGRPGALILFLAVTLAGPLTEWAKPWVHTTRACDFGAGGGSLDTCDNAIDYAGFALGLVIGTVLAWVSSEIVLRALHLRWRSPLIGIGALYGYSALSFLVGWFSVGILNAQAIWGNQRGSVTGVCSGLYLLVTVGVFFHLTFGNLRQYQSGETAQTHDLQPE